ncbi:UbiA-like protein EboC [Reichenbachiella sp. MALMAid0571]|uniref:UbiA-like protein EboC n=1 Tax=Reichenbachiella sp. MALMAid0571 TaxID=3143939 RepID=UPI0032DF00DF
MRLFPFLVLMRPANIVTAISDIVAGVAIAGVLGSGISSIQTSNFIYLILSTIGLYGGGIVFNDVFDFETDQKERPERPIPSGKVTYKQAVFLGSFLLTFGVGFASLVSVVSMLIAIVIVITALFYNKYAKHNIVAGPLNMGICRGLNLLLGMSVISGELPEFWMICFIPIVFIAAITLTSQGEVLGNNKMSVVFALSLDVMVAGVIILLAWNGIMNLWTVLPFVILWISMNLSAKLKAISTNEPKYIMKAVKMGVLSLIPLNASYVAGFSNWTYGLAVLLLLPISIILSKKFAVT